MQLPWVASREDKRFQHDAWDEIPGGKFLVGRDVIAVIEKVIVFAIGIQ
jgi:hypothetical protein